MRATTLADLNALHPPTFRDWNGLTLRREYAVGRAGRRGAGAHCHLLRVEIVAAVNDPTNGARVGDVIDVRGASANDGCASRGRGTVVAGADIAQVTCKRCATKLAELAAVRRAQGVQ